mmetsp:Transcript_49180/g.143166  ORF Transcript_49180/g.143166 Transcript_49180/m.143166 type:complete len:513 (+) Transcript_49180:85-1623(+)
MCESVSPRPGRKSAPAGVAPCLPSSCAEGRFVITGKLGSGRFGQVLLATDRHTNEEVAVKLEDRLAGFIEQEAAWLQRIHAQGPQQGFVRLVHFGNEPGCLKCMVMPRLGANLREILTAAGGKLGMKTVVLVAQQMVSCVEYMHSVGIVHRDMKWQNVLTGMGPRAHHLQMVDFGLAAEFFVGREHLEQHSVPSFQGNFRFASVDAHRCLTQSRRSDLEALGYMLVCMSTGQLPWASISSKDWRMKNRQILEMKVATSPAELAAGLPAAFGQFMFDVRGLEFSTRPDYTSYARWFSEARDELGALEGVRIEDHHMQWIEPSETGSEAWVPLEPQENLKQPDDRRGFLVSPTFSWLSMRPERGRLTWSQPKRDVADNDVDDIDGESVVPSPTLRDRVERWRTAALTRFRPLGDVSGGSPDNTPSERMVSFATFMSCESNRSGCSDDTLSSRGDLRCKAKALGNRLWHAAPVCMVAGALAGRVSDPVPRVMVTPASTGDTPTAARCVTSSAVDA